MAGFLRIAVNALFRERHSTAITVSIPTHLYMAMETLIYVRNETSEGEVDKDYIVGLALVDYLQKHLVDKNEEKIAAIPPAPPKPPEFTEGRKQARYQSYQDYKATQ